MKFTVPTAFDGATVAVNVTLAPLTAVLFGLIAREVVVVVAPLPPLVIVYVVADDPDPVNAPVSDGTNVAVSE